MPGSSDEQVNGFRAIRAFRVEGCSLVFGALGPWISILLFRLTREFKVSASQIQSCRAGDCMWESGLRFLASFGSRGSIGTSPKDGPRPIPVYREGS